jgi:Flp pilus assembly protein TadG
VVGISLVVLLGMAALAIDLSSFYKAQRQAQSAADAAALGAAQELPSSASAAASTATTYGQQNYPGATVTVTTPYGGSTSQIRVTVSAATPSFFGQIFGVTSANVSASATAGPPAGSSYDALFTSDTSCSGAGITISGSSQHISGGVHSNGKISIPGANNALGPTTYGGPNSCPPPPTGGSNTYTSGPTLDTANVPWPIDYTSYGANAANCTYTSASTGTAYSFGTNSATIPPGVYCALNGTISVTGTSIIAAGVTFIAKTITLNNTLAITPASGANGLTIYQTGTATMNLSGSGLLQGGTIFAPNAAVQIGGSGTESGFIEAKDITISGSSFTFIGTGPSTGGIGTIALLQ